MIALIKRATAWLALAAVGALCALGMAFCLGWMFVYWPQ